MILSGWSRCLLPVMVILTATACQPGSHNSLSQPASAPTPVVTPLVPQPDTPSPTPSPSPSPTLPPGPVVAAVRLDADHLLVTTTQDGHPTRFEAVDGRGGRKQLALPSPDLGAGSYIRQAFTSGGQWFVATSNCDAGLRLYSSKDAGRVWSSATDLGYLGCHAGDDAIFYGVGRGRVLVRSSGVREVTTIDRSTDGTHWPTRSLRSDDGASTLAFHDDGSYVRVWGSLDLPQQKIVHASSIGSEERSTSLPGGAQPIGYTLTRAGNRYVLLSATGVPYSSADGGTWAALTSAFPGCVCSRLNFTALSAHTWWVQARDGKSSRYAVTRDSAHSWQEVPGPPGPAPLYPNVLTAWNSTSAVVERVGSPWVTTDSGQHWQRL